MMSAMVFPEISPVALDLGFFQIRWYALGYLAGFVLGWRYALALVRQRPGLRPNAEDIDIILPWLVLGVILGGRLGYVLFYNLGYFIENPWHIPFVWEGGMSFHGGLMGVATVIIGYALRNRFSPLLLGDVVACVVPIGLFFGRIANFINGELFGRVTSSPLGIVFPYGGPLPRHPSQLYEALLEGVVLGLVLFLAARRPALRDRPGALFGIFLAGYGLCRFTVEFFREPDPQIGLLLDYFSMGQVLSLPMVFAGAALIRFGHRLKLKNEKSAG